MFVFYLPFLFSNVTATVEKRLADKQETFTVHKMKFSIKGFISKCDGLGHIY